jgi:hypothetical protein
LIALRLDELSAARVRWLLSACGLLTVAFPIAARVLPGALISGLSHAPRPHFEPAWLVGAAAAILAWQLDRRGRRLAAVAAVASAASLGILQLKIVAAPRIDAMVSARSLWRMAAPHRDRVCLGDVKRDWDYGLAYYAGYRLPRCEERAEPWEVVPAPPDGAELRPAARPKP